jgi:ubiquinone/menaquinone biosynthesis C-methylase UbiE
VISSKMRNLDNLVEDYYQKYYDLVHGSQWKFSFLSIHAAIEAKFRRDDHYEKCLELGTGNGQHLGFLNHQYDIYIATDVRPIINPSLTELEEGELPQNRGKYKSFGDATKLLYKDESFDRLIAGCLLLHLPNTLQTIDEWVRVTKVGGRIDALVPTSSLTVSLYRSIFSRRKAKKLGCFDYDLVHALEHVTYYERVIEIVLGRYDDFQIEVQHFPQVLGRVKFLRGYSVIRIIKGKL